MEEAQTKWPEWPALLEWPLTKREWGQDDHLRVLLCANAPLALSVHDSGEKKGIWHMWTFLSITQYKVLQQVTHGDWGQRSHRSLLSRKLHSKVKAYWKLFFVFTSLRLSSYFCTYFTFRKFLVLHSGSIFFTLRHELTLHVNQSTPESQPNKL